MACNLNSFLWDMEYLTSPNNMCNLVTPNNRLTEYHKVNNKFCIHISLKRNKNFLYLLDYQIGPELLIINNRAKTASFLSKLI